MGEPAVQHRDLDAWSGTALMEIDTDVPLSQFQSHGWSSKASYPTPNHAIDRRLAP